MLAPVEIEEALASGYELRGLELKGPGPRTNTQLFAKVTRAVLSMGNLRDGGHVIIGIDDANQAALLPGLDQPDLDSWIAYDDVARKMAEYADPPLRFDIAALTLSSGAAVAVLQVFEFSDIPHLCAKDYPGVLRNGALYVRPRKVPETSEVATSSEMRDVIDLATEKALRAYVETARRAGVGLALPGSETVAAPDVDLFAAERRDAWQ